MSHSIVGTYKLVEYGYHYKVTSDFRPIADFYSGFIHYGDDGFMSVCVRFSETPELDDTVAYFAEYKISGRNLIHKVMQSARPSYEGQTLERTFDLTDNILYTEFENTDEFIKFARWKKQSPSF